LGHSVERTWEALLAGRSGIGPVTHFDATAYLCRIASEVKDFNPDEFMDPKEVKRTDRYVQFAVAAAKMALRDSDLNPSADPESYGVVIGTGIGGLYNIQTHMLALIRGGPRKVSPFMIPSTIGNSASGMVAIETGARGPNYATVSACSSGTHAVGEAFKMVRLGEADVVVAGGSEAAIVELAFAGFCSMRAMSTGFNDEPQRASRPFDLRRDGFVMGEGAGVLILEEWERARRRNAKIYAEIIAYSATADAFHITRPDPKGRALVSCFEKIFTQSNVSKSDVQYINLHGTSTPYNDAVETRCVKCVFGDGAKDISLSSTKSMLGHLLGATGAIEAIVAVKAIHEGHIPPTVNYEVPDPDCDLNYTPNVSVSRDIRFAISDNLGFGGQNAALLFGKV
jgi:3-oxoacyl-[acyl-carrier-protein] synthase II